MRTSRSRRADWQRAMAPSVVLLVLPVLVLLGVVDVVVVVVGGGGGKGDERGVVPWAWVCCCWRGRGAGEGVRSSLWGRRRGLGTEGSLLELLLLRGLSGAGEEVPLRAARGGGAMKVLLLGAVVVVLEVRVVLGEVREGRGGERGPLTLPLPLPLPLPGLAPAPGPGRRFAGEVMSLRSRGMGGVVIVYGFNSWVGFDRNFVRRLRLYRKELPSAVGSTRVGSLRRR